MSLTSITIRLDNKLKQELDIHLGEIGLSFEDYMKLAAEQFVIQNKVPFEIVMPEEIPNRVTRIAMVEAEAKDLGIIPDDIPEFTNVEDLKKYLNK
ncbi:damage-inducible protein J [Companilactobacillus ginsenosidimutans]|uniref:Damage-inducible protein J n=2 Tax=Companilactobacillus ginsenosidimutans TaxID=1007676 RepID=A0A0H4QLI3_9LACO|nr:type II toxin-antitoxin system RelB/DinJ family antitoxin [Companilactobacillus ginsenosidimutans]AKP67563.1 damage-inducible protein J [Companilactobacillus ginsenosidimutans]